MQMPDGNTSALSDYLASQDYQEHMFQFSKIDKQNAIIDYAKKILRAGVVKEEFDWAMCEYLDLLEDDEVYTKEFNEALDNWNLKIHHKDEIEAEMLWKICHSALSAASEILYDIEFEEIFDNLGKAIKGVMNNDN